MTSLNGFVILCASIACCAGNELQNLQCGDSSNLKTTLIQTPENISTRCVYVIEPYSSRVCQLKIKMNEFRLQQPQQLPSNDALTCVDRFEVNNMVICGNNDGQHIYVPFDVIGGTDSNINLVFDLPTIASSKRWSLVVIQLECPTITQQNGLLGFQDILSQNTNLTAIAPIGCTQYFTERTGTFESFNYNNGIGPYPPNLNYAICFQRRIGDSAIEFTFTDLLMPNNLLNMGLDGDCYAPIFTAGKEEDYLLIPAALVQRSGIKPTYICGSWAKGKVITCGVPGPFVIYFNSDDINSGDNVGFKISYEIK